jgi:hypothetical protein
LAIVIPNRFIGEESAFAPEQQIPRAIRPRFGMTIPAMIQAKPPALSEFDFMPLNA